MFKWFKKTFSKKNCKACEKDYRLEGMHACEVEDLIKVRQRKAHEATKTFFQKAHENHVLSQPRVVETRHSVSSLPHGHTNQVQGVRPKPAAYSQPHITPTTKTNRYEEDDEPNYVSAVNVLSYSVAFDDPTPSRSYDCTPDTSSSIGQCCDTTPSYSSDTSSSNDYSCSAPSSFGD